MTAAAAASCEPRAASIAARFPSPWGWFFSGRVSAAATGGTARLPGGQETPVVSLMLPLLPHGMLSVGLPSPQAELNATRDGGPPYGASHFAGIADDRPLADAERTLCIAQGRRLAEVALKLTGSRVVELRAGHAGVDQTYREIYDVVHGAGFWAGDGDAGYRVNVRSLIKRIRQKFTCIDPDFQAIENYPGYGYRWRGADTAATDAADNSFDDTAARFSA